MILIFKFLNKYVINMPSTNFKMFTTWNDLYTLTQIQLNSFVKYFYYFANSSICICEYRYFLFLGALETLNGNVGHV